MSTYPKLNVKTIIKPILKNYNRHVQRFCDILESVNCQLIYDGPENIHDHIRDKKSYSCSVKCFNEATTATTATTTTNNQLYFNTNNANKKYKILKSVFPIMIGSKLDVVIRKKRIKNFNRADLIDDSNSIDSFPFEPMDIASTYFIINGCVRHLPYFYTNDPTNTHIVKKKIVRCYSYDDDKGKELSLYVQQDDNKHKRGDLIVVLNDGSESDQVQGFFDHCPYFIDQKVYMSKIYRDRNFDIDHLANKIIVSPGHLFVKLFSKYVLNPLRDRDWVLIRSKAAMVVKSIESGSLLHVLSRKTLYFKESKSTPKMVNVPQENHRELGMNGEIYVEKDIGCYREISMQTYPLNPFLSHMIIRQISSKVKKGIVPAFNGSYLGYFCSLGDMETKNIGRTNMMVRNTYVSTNEDVSLVYNLLNLIAIQDDPYLQNFFVVVNEACVPVTEKCFNDIDLLTLKNRLKYIECYKDGNFILIRYKIGLMFKKIRINNNNNNSVWVTARDQFYWLSNYSNYDYKNFLTFNDLTGYLVDLNPFFKYNVFTKNILAFNTLKNAVLATDPLYCEYFMETLSAYTKLTPYHTVVCEPVDSFSSHFVLRLPLVNVTYMSFKGINQEDCIVLREDVDAFDCFRFHTIRLKFEPANQYVTFHPKRGDAFPDDYYVGHIVCHHDNDNKKKPFTICPQTIHAKLVPVGNNNNNNNNNNESHQRKIFKLYFSKPNFKVVRHHLTKDGLSICLSQDRLIETGDKLCSFHGQKGVIRKEKCFPTFGEERLYPDIIVNPYSLFRMTCGQLKEGIYWGGKDVKIIYNSDGKLMSTLNDDGVFFGKTFYFPVAYWAREHFYAPKICTMDKILGQPVKGRSRGGGMRLGNMEIMNGLRGNGIANCFEEKILENADRMFYNNKKESENVIVPLPKSTLLCRDDAKFFKCDLSFTTVPCLETIDENKS